MIQKETILKVADNSGAKTVVCIGVSGGGKTRKSFVGGKIKVAVRSALSSSKIKKGTVLDAVIVRTKGGFCQFDGTKVTFDENAVVLIKESGDPLGTRVFGPVSRKLKTQKYSKIVSLAPQVL